MKMLVVFVITVFMFFLYFYHMRGTDCSWETYRLWWVMVWSIGTVILSINSGHSTGHCIWLYYSISWKRNLLKKSDIHYSTEREREACLIKPDIKKVATELNNKHYKDFTDVYLSDFSPNQHCWYRDFSKPCLILLPGTLNTSSWKSNFYSVFFYIFFKRTYIHGG